MLSRTCAAVLLACCMGAGGQDQAGDALANTLRQASDLIAKGHAGDAAQMLEPIALRASADRSAGELQYLTGLAFYRVGKYDRAEQFWNTALADERAVHDRAHEARTLRWMAQMRKNQASYGEGLQFANDALDIFTSLGDE